MASKNTTKAMKGRRTGVTVAPPGQIPLDGDGMEDLDAFWKSESGEANGSNQANESRKRAEKTNRRKDVSPIPKPNFELFRDSNSGALTEADKKRSGDLARRALVRQSRLNKRGLLSPEDQSVATDATDATELSAIEAVSVQSPVLVALTPVAKRRDDVEEDEESSVGGKSANDPVSPMTPAAFSVASEERSSEKERKLDSLLDEKIENKDTRKAPNEYPQEHLPDSDGPVDFGDDGGNYGYEDNYSDGGGDEGGYGFEVAQGHSSSEEPEEVLPGSVHARVKVSDEEDGDDHNNESALEEEEENSSASIVEEETPKKVRQERARKERKKLLMDAAKKKKKKKKKKSSSSVVSFSSPASAYIVSGPRDYESIPISDFKSDGYDSDEEPGLRRSKRARFRPLQYWKNERLLYEANEEPEVLGDMAVVTKVQKALPTPMKKIKRRKPKKKEYDSEDDEEDLKRRKDRKAVSKKFDKRKLNRDFIYKNDENALIWDEGTREFSERSK